MERFRIQTFDDSTHLTVRISGEVDLASAQALTQAFSLALSVERPIMVDCAQITFADSAALSVLAEARDLAEKCRVRFQLSGVPEPLRQVLDLSGTASLFDIAEEPRTDGIADLPAAIPGQGLPRSEKAVGTLQTKYEAVAA
ncbi:MAG: STAS domain-containing protein [Catenulispora sp.]|nr:STAS domain-containing protein [Catenulispora sp.]